MPTVTQPDNFTGTVAGIAIIYISSISKITNASPIISIASSYYAICLALNVLITLMIITKLILHRKNLRHAIGGSSATTGVYTTIVIMLVESCALYAIALLAVVVTWASQSVGLPITIKILSNVQVCAASHSPSAQAWNDILPHRSLFLVSSFYELPGGER